ncbi:MAG: ABC transporter permease [Paludibacteraceae bacterium]|nr:ABC transporter permease [Paludibacteraceae bacterium]MBR6520748.1 ABC transporter permease [Paludibacteraceae bacterium]
MFDLDNYQEIWHTITRNKTRSLLTAFGVFWGMFMLVVMVALGSGISRGIMGQLDGVAQNTSMMFPSNTSMPYKGFKRGRSWNMHSDDLVAMEREFAELKYISPVMWVYNIGKTARGTKSEEYRMMGHDANYFKMYPLKIVQGRWINDIDLRDTRKVCVIGEKVLNDLYKPGENAVGTLLRVGSSYYTVIGVVKKVSDGVNFFGNMDEMLLVPYTTAQRIQNSGDVVHCLCITAYDNVEIGDVEKRVAAFVKERNLVNPDDEAALELINLKKIFDSFSMLFGGLNFLVWVVGLGTLLSGVIGVSNIMLVTVRERTQEIGIRRALGATPFTIIKQIMSESLVLTFIASFAGLFFAVIVLGIVDVVMSAQSNPFMASLQLSFSLSIIALLIIIFSGMIAGYLPSKRALSIKAVEALQDE